MEQTTTAPWQEEAIPAPASAHTQTHTRSESSASSETACSTNEKRHSSTSTSSIVKEKGHRHTCSTASSTDLEAQLSEVDDFSQKRFGFIRYTALNVYRRLFSLAFIGNAIGFIVLMARGAAPLDLVNASAINLAVCGLCRHPLVVNMLFLTFGARHGRGVVRLVHRLRGVYTYNFTPSPLATAALVLIWIVLAFLLAIIIVAHPAFRAKCHDYFELTHRFSNWLILALFWALLFLLGSQQPSLAGFLLHLPAFWILILLTLATIHPWLLLRRVPVVAEPLSPHAVRLHFAHTSVRFGQGISVARHPLADWHSFASFTDQFDAPATRFSCLVSRAGDWTRAAIASPPAHLWTRGVPTYGFGYVFRMFERIVVVTTGSGIGPCLSFIEDARRPAMRVVWQARSPLETYGQRTLDLVRRMDAEPVIIDSKVSGRVDMLPVVLRLYKDFGADAVCVISNAKMTKSLVYSLETRGIAAYGPIFDS
ncbi:0b3530c3-3ac1-4aea-a445-1680822ce573 [Thermothielavioides terrestris]|uniref:0b3530c3-3ac1-4aea-a445-1680822ce573 n=1 Tax=Thermothielavioides terrestris TaxID=2587410 RepID=A0A3S5CVI7_9PEZI|nr:0b3530c3-3ac1-4aea-a445-1680822ce573 [Thermothielavioides terrestris]